MEGRRQKALQSFQKALQVLRMQIDVTKQGCENSFLYRFCSAVDGGVNMRHGGGLHRSEVSISSCKISFEHLSILEHT